MEIRTEWDEMGHDDLIRVSEPLPAAKPIEADILGRLWGDIRLIACGG